MNKAELIAKLWDTFGQKNNLTKKAVGEMFDMLVGMIIDALKKGDQVKIPELGTFVKKFKPAGPKMNPRTKEMINVPAKNVPKFRASKALKQAVN